MNPKVRKVHASGVVLSVVDAGEGDSVLLLHGVPDSSELWRNQIPALTSAGFRVIAPDLRGFGASDRPDGREAYGVPALVGDALAVLDALEVGSARVVGHDFGAVVGWSLAAFVPDRVDRLAALSVGHPNAYFASRSQRELSWYMLLFGFEGVAEEWLPQDDWRRLRMIFDDPPDIDRYTADLSRPGALTAALNLYRANIAPRDLISGEQPLPRIDRPVLGVWSAGDRLCGEEQMRDSGNFADDWRYERIEDAGHWIPLDAPERLNELLVSFLKPRG